MLSAMAAVVVREVCGGCEGGAGGECERAAGADGGCGVGGVGLVLRGKLAGAATARLTSATG
jgi:hypothetical protein